MQRLHQLPDSPYWLESTAQILSPSLLVFRELVDQNLATMLQIAGDPARLRPHCKTHKMPRVVELELRRGIEKHKAATLAEAEMLARAGAIDILLAYNAVGPNIARVVSYLKAFPNVSLAVAADHEEPLRQLDAAMLSAQQTVEVLLDVDTGQHRTGVPVGQRATGLYKQIVESQGLIAGGLHIYDGHQKQKSLDARRQAVRDELERVLTFRDELHRLGWPVPRLVCGGTVTFPVYAELAEPGLELSPGTCVFFDTGYRDAFPDLPFQPAAALLTRVVSCPDAGRLTLDLGYKAVAADPPAEQRVVFPDIPDARIVLQNEEHLVIESSTATRYAPGDELLAFPWHICPTSALHRRAPVFKQGKQIEEWEVTARDRQLTL